MSAQTPELQSKIAIWRAKAADGTLSIEEMREAIVALRAGRVSAAQASTASRQARAKTNIPNATDLLASLKGSL